MLSKDIQKGMRVVLKNGWEADVISKPKGTRICLRVYGFETEIGDCWLKDVAAVRTCSPDFDWEPLELNDKQKKQAAEITKMEALYR